MGSEMCIRDSDTGENYNGGKDNRMQKAEREIRDKTSGGKEQESLTRRK